MADEQNAGGSPLRDAAEEAARSMSRSPEPAADGNGAGADGNGNGNGAEAAAPAAADGMQTEEQAKAAEERKARREEQRRRQAELREISPSKLVVDEELRTLFTAAVQAAVDRALLPTNVSWLNDYIRSRVTLPEGEKKWDCVKRCGGMFSTLCRVFEQEGLITLERRKESVVVV
jgi:hypothetical protein